MLSTLCGVPCGLPGSRPWPAPPARRRMSNGNFYAALSNLSIEDDERLGHNMGPLADLALAREMEAEAIEDLAGSPTAPAAAPPAAAAAAGPGGKDKRNFKYKDPLVWIDLEMTGLDIQKDTILELACIVTDGDLKGLIEGPNLAIHHPDEVLANMNAWCVEQHGKSGLTQRCRDSTVSLADAEEQLLQFIQAHTAYQSAQLAGNSVHVDRLFLLKHMPRVVEHLHYRIVDVSSIGELCRRWLPKVARHVPKKMKKHTAMSDIRESVKELMYYKQKVFRSS